MWAEILPAAANAEIAHARLFEEIHDFGARLMQFQIPYHLPAEKRMEYLDGWMDWLNGRYVAIINLIAQNAVELVAPGGCTNPMPQPDVDGVAGLVDRLLHEIGQPADNKDHNARWAADTRRRLGELGSLLVKMHDAREALLASAPKATP